MTNHVRNILFFLIVSLFFAFSASGCISQKPGVNSPDDIIHFPIGVAVHPSGYYAAVVNSDFNQAYKNGSLVIVDLTNFTIVSEWTVPIGIFGSEVIFNHAGTRMFVTVRGEMQPQYDLEYEPSDVLIAYDVNMDVASKPIPDDPEKNQFLVRSSRDVHQISPDPFGLAIDDDDRYIYISHISNGEMTIMQDTSGIFTSESEQLDYSNGVEIRRCVPDNQSCSSEIAAGELCGSCSTNSDCGTTNVVVAGSAGGVPLNETNSCLEDPRNQSGNFCATYCEVDRTTLNDDNEVVRIGCPEGFRCETIQPLRELTVRKFSTGGNQVAISPATGTVYISHRDYDVLGVLRPYYEHGTGYQTRVEQVEFGTGSDMRGMAFDSIGSKLFLAARNEISGYNPTPGLLVIDTTLKTTGCNVDQIVKGTTTCESNELVDFIEIDYQPANVAIYKEFLYVAIYGMDQIYVIDLRTRTVTAIIDLAPDNFIEEPGIFREDARPYDITIYENSTGVWALVSNFASHEIAVVHLFDENGTILNRVERKIENRAKLYEDDQF